ncbi:MAG: TIGR04255 family protein [Alphaproteobacteria bacterium]|nr:TIGR04255 family protein [Alphaproteobacteria bacterium]
MSNREIFPNAPITEALIDLRVVIDDENLTEHLATVVEQLKGEFPTVEKRVQLTFAIAPGEEPNPPNESEEIGSVLHSENREKAIQVRINGFTYSKLKPYQDWEELRDNTRRLWSVFRDTTKPKRVVRLASRFINRIELPLPVDFDEYFNTKIQIADELPQGIAEQFCRIVVPQLEQGLVAVITTTLEKPGEDRTIIPFLFDIDVFKDVDYEVDADEIWDDLERIREYKDDIFFYSTTEKAKNLFR